MITNKETKLFVLSELCDAMDTCACAACPLCDYEEAWCDTLLSDVEDIPEEQLDKNLRRWGIKVEEM